jgi:hypothetical protein
MAALSVVLLLAVPFFVPRVNAALHLWSFGLSAAVGCGSGLFAPGAKREGGER